MADEEITTKAQLEALKIEHSELLAAWEASKTENMQLATELKDSIVKYYQELSEKIDRLEQDLSSAELRKSQNYAKKFTIRLDEVLSEKPKNEDDYRTIGYGLLTWNVELNSAGDKVMVHSILTCGHIGVLCLASGIKSVRVTFVRSTPEKAIECNLNGSLFVTKEYIDGNGADLCMLGLRDCVCNELGYANDTIEWEPPSNILGLDVYGRSSDHIKGGANLKDPSKSMLLVHSFAVPGTCGTPLFFEKDGKVRIAALVQNGFNEEDAVSRYPSAAELEGFYPLVHACGKEKEHACILYQVKLKHIKEVMKYVQWRKKRDVQGPTMKDKMNSWLLRNFCKSHMDLSSKFLKDEAAGTIGTSFVSWTDDATRSTVPNGSLILAPMQSPGRTSEQTEGA